ncbi:MAG: polysaccharide biosynthesis/export family protein [Candidatus Aminicenantales bacterium]
MRKTILLFALILAGAVYVSAQQQGQEQEAKDIFVKAYRIGPGDLLEIKVFEVEQLNQVVRVSEDGSITLPLLGRIEIEGLTQSGVVQKLTNLLQAKYVKNPQVTVFIKEYKSQQVAVIGAVEKPGNYELVGRKNLLQMISQAGGLTDKATDEIFILRDGGDGTASSIPIDLKDLMVNGNQKLNIPIEPNDVINVPVDKEIRVFVFGRVTQPGALKFKISEKVTLLSAIAQAGGLAEGAKQSGVLITRKDKSGKEQKIRVNLKEVISGKRKDIPLQEGDVVFVPESFWTP